MCAPTPPADPPRPTTIDPDLDRSIRDGCAHAVMLGTGEAFLSPFAVFLGAGATVVGLLGSVPLLLGALAQLFTVHLLRRGQRPKGLVTVPSLLQGLSWILIFLLPYSLPEYGTTLLVALVLFYFAIGSFIAPAWNSWMGDIVPPEIRGEYFGRRDKLRTTWQLVALIVAGGVLNLATSQNREWLGFAGIFGAAVLARLVSWYYLQGMTDPPHRVPTTEDYFRFRDFLRRIPGSNFGRFTVYVAAMQAATQFSGPFFLLYMLRDLEFNYVEFTSASPACVLAQVLTFQNWGKVSDRFGNFNVLRLTGFLVPFIPLLWLFSASVWAIILFQIASGIVWAGFNLSTANFIFDAVTPPKRARCVAYHNVFMYSGYVMGAMTGGLVAPHLPDELTILGWTWQLESHLVVLFLISGLLRLLISLAFLRLIREVREVEKGPPGWRVIVQVVGLSPIRGMRFSVFAGVHPREWLRRRDPKGKGGRPGTPPDSARGDREGL